MLTIATGYDPGYLTKQTLTSAKNYYTIAVTQHGEPPGVWWGPGVEALGFTPGSAINPLVMEKLYSSFVDPRDENFLNRAVSDREKRHLGICPPRYKDASAWYEQLLKREPEATPERRKELRNEAVQKEGRQKTVFFYDATFSVPKSVSLLHAGLLSAAQVAERAGNFERAAQYRERAEAVERAVMAGASASLEYLREHAGAARTGHHGRKVESRTTGRWTPAGGWVVTQFLQHTNRAGEPQMHVHNAILGRQLCEDGKWRGIDSRALFRSRPGAAAAGERKLFQDLTRDLGVEAVERADGNGFELKGVSAEEIIGFSSRRTMVTTALEQKIQDYVGAHGRLPNARVMYKMAQEATLDTRRTKEPKLDRQALLAKWEKLADGLELGKLASLPHRVLGRIDPERNAALAYEPTQIEMDRIITTAVARVQEAKAVFSRHDVYRRINDQLPPNLGALSDQQVHALVNSMTDLALSPAGPADVRLLNAPEIVLMPAELRDVDGRSVYVAPNAERFTTKEQLDNEQELIAEALRLDAPRIHVEPAEAEAEPAETDAVSVETAPGVEGAPAAGATVEAERQDEAIESTPTERSGESVADEAVDVSSSTGEVSAEAAGGWDEAPTSSDGNAVDPHEGTEISADDPHVSLNEGQSSKAGPDPAGEIPNTGTPTTENPGQEVVRSLEQERLIQAHRDAAAWFQAQLRGEGGQAARDYVTHRGFAHALAEDSPWQIGYAPGGGSRYALFNHLSALGYTNDELLASGLVLRTENGGVIDRFRERVVLPVLNSTGEPVAFVGRNTPAAISPAKWMNSPESPIYSKKDVLFGVGQQREALAAGARPVVVEGPFDVLAVAGAREDDGPGLVAVAPCGTALTAEQVAELSTVADDEAGVVVAFDGDKAGQKAAVRAYDLLRDHPGPVNAATLPPGVDPGDLADDPERLHDILDERDRLLLDVAIIACVDSHRWTPTRYEGSTATPEEMLREAAESWGFAPEEIQASVQQKIREREDGHQTSQPRMERPRYQEGDLTPEACSAAIRQAAELIDPDAPNAGFMAMRAVDRLVEETGAPRDIVLDAMFPTDEPAADLMQPSSPWDRKRVVASLISPQTQAAWREEDQRRAAEQAAVEAESAKSPELSDDAAETVPAPAEVEDGGVEPDQVWPQMPRVSEETARALRESAQVRAELLDRYPRLHIDQADAIAGIATSGRGVDVLVGPAGSGKSTTVGYLADLWKDKTNAPVVGLATAQNAANILGAKKVNGAKAFDATHNIAKWLYLVESGKERIVPGSLIVVDEASMVTTTQLKDIQEIASQARAKVVWAGDHAQLSAPGAAGAMRHLVELGGAYELTAVHRFAEPWEAKASLQLRDGAVEALTTYDKHGRLMAGSRADVEAEALRGYLADLLDGKDTLLLTSTNENASTLSRQVRAALIEAGLVEANGTRLRDANTAGRGDLIMARGNDTKITVGDEERALSNRDVLRVVDIEPGGGIRAVLIEEGTETETVVTLPAEYVSSKVELAYAGTTHAAQGRDVDTCYSIVDDRVTAEMLYVMLTRAEKGNYGFGVAEDTSADLRIGPDQAQEYTAQVRQTAARERGEHLPRDQEAERARLAREADEQRLSVFAAAMQREAADPMATEAMLGEAELPRHLGHLGAMWVDMTREYTARGYLERAAQRGVLPPKHLERALKEEALGTLGRMLTQLDMAGYKADTILDGAISSRELDSADEVTQVLYWRIAEEGGMRNVDVTSLDPSEEQINATWSERTKDLGVPTIDVARHDIAQRMDERTRELAERVAHKPPRWLVEHIGPAPAETHGREREQWMQRAGRVLGYREQWMYKAESDAIGPAPSRANPEQRASWLAAHDALGVPEGGRDLSGASLGELYVARAAYERETRWAPAYVADELRTASRQARELDQQVSRLRAAANQEVDPERRTALEAQAQARADLAEEMHAHRQDLIRIDTARQGWYEATEDKRILAERADQELRRRAERDAAENKPTRVDVEALRPLALDGAGGREYEEAQQRRVETEEAERNQVHPNQMSLDDITAPGPVPEAVDAEPVETEAPQVEQVAERVEIEDPEPVVDEQMLAEAEADPVVWEPLLAPEFAQAEFTAFGATPEAEVQETVDVVEAEIIDGPEPEPRPEPVEELVAIDVEVTSEIVEGTAQVTDEGITVTEVEAVDPWQRLTEPEREPERERPVEPTTEPEREREPEVSADQPTLWDEVIDNDAELDRVIDQARHAADLAAYRNQERDATMVAQEEADREYRQQQAREVDTQLAEREEAAREQVEEREAERAAEQPVELEL